MRHTPRPGADDPKPYDIVIVGAGLAGTIAAIVLGRRSYRVALIDLHARVPAQFRVEKIAGDQIEILRRLDLLGPLQAVATPFNEIVNARHGRLLDHTRQANFGVYYGDLGNAMRLALPASVDFVVGRVDDISTTATIQSVSIAGRDALNARLVVLATGLGDALRRKLGIRHKVIHEKQSLTFGFNIVPGGEGPMRYPALTYNGDLPSEAIDYLSLFPVGDDMRANLFTFLAPKDPRVGAFRKNPKETLTRALPGLVPVLGDFEVRGKVEAWPVDLSVVENSIQDGVVLIGDAYQTSCPAAGTGVTRILTDVERLCTVHAPAWMETQGMGAEKIAQFYEDRQKQAMDRRALDMAHYRRNFTVATGMTWQARRQLSVVKRRILAVIDRVNPTYVTTLRRLLARSA